VDAELSVWLDELYHRSHAYDQTQSDRLQRWRNVEPDTAKLMAVLIRTLGAQRLLELGTSNGYSTIWLADGARATGGRVTSVEIDPDRSAEAGRNLRQAGVEEFVELRVQDAGELLAGSDDHAWDFIFLDAERPAYTSYWPDLRRVLAPSGLLIVDNVLSHAEQVADFREIVSADPTVIEALTPTGAGVLLVSAINPHQA
jgi:predicted O-methyltransferase YrrM